jgi:hypothetical protein
MFGMYHLPETSIDNIEPPDIRWSRDWSSANNMGAATNQGTAEKRKLNSQWILISTSRK